jgi:hypothetical protein
MIERAWIILSIVLVAALVFIVCALAFIVATRGLPRFNARTRMRAGRDQMLPGAPERE